MEKAPNTMPSARPRSAFGTASLTMAMDERGGGPPNSPATTRAAMSERKPVAKPPSAVAGDEAQHRDEQRAPAIEAIEKERAESPATDAAAV